MIGHPGSAGGARGDGDVHRHRRLLRSTSGRPPKSNAAFLNRHFRLIGHIPPLSSSRRRSSRRRSSRRRGSRRRWLAPSVSERERMPSPSLPPKASDQLFKRPCASSPRLRPRCARSRDRARPTSRAFRRACRSGWCRSPVTLFASGDLCESSHPTSTSRNLGRSGSTALRINVAAVRRRSCGVARGMPSRATMARRHPASLFGLSSSLPVILRAEHQLSSAVQRPCSIVVSRLYLQ